MSDRVALTLTYAELWVLKEALTNHSVTDDYDLAGYIVHKCQKNGITEQRCRELLDSFDLLAFTEEADFDRYEYWLNKYSGT